MLNNDNFKTLPEFFNHLKNIMKIEITITDDGCDIDETSNNVIVWSKKAGIDQWTSMLETINNLNNKISQLNDQLDKCRCNKLKTKTKKLEFENYINSESDNDLVVDDDILVNKKNKQKKTKRRMITAYNVYVSEKVKSGELLFKECGCNWKNLSVDERTEYANKAKYINENANLDK